jgi:hypothetical protein
MTNEHEKQDLWVVGVPCALGLITSTAAALSADQRVRMLATLIGAGVITISLFLVLAAWFFSRRCKATRRVMSHMADHIVRLNKEVVATKKTEDQFVECWTNLNKIYRTVCGDDFVDQHPMQDPAVVIDAVTQGFAHSVRVADELKTKVQIRDAALRNIIRMAAIEPSNGDKK